MRFELSLLFQHGALDARACEPKRKRETSWSSADDQNGTGLVICAAASRTRVRHVHISNVFQTDNVFHMVDIVKGCYVELPRGRMNTRGQMKKGTEIPALRRHPAGGGYP